MRSAACWIVRRRRRILALTLMLAAICGALIPGVRVNSDMTQYLPEDSQMRAGMRLMETEFPAEEDAYTVRAMFGGLSPEQRERRLEDLRALPQVTAVAYAPDSPDYNHGDWALYVLTTKYGYNTPEEAALERTLREELGATVANDDTSAPEIPLTVYVVAFGVILLILLLACDSYFEPLLFLVTIGVAVALNLGTNYFLGEISDVTAGVAAILQLALSMDYSIILMNRYRQELAVTDDRTEAMENALTASFGAIAGSGFTTIVGLLMLLFMSFQIGTDLGVVLAKGVAFSMLCVFTALPGLILLFHKAIEKTGYTTDEIKIALDAAGRSVKQVWTKVYLPCPYSWFERIRLEVTAFGGVIENTDFGADVSFDLLLPEAQAEPFLARVLDLSAGTIEGLTGDNVYRAYPL